MSATSVVVSGEANIAQQTTGANYRAGTGSPNKNEERQIFDEALCNFREAVKWTGFVDRSLLIKELLSKTYPRRVMIFAPKCFGKSMNLDMVKRFLEIEPGRDITNAPQDLKELEKFENFKAFCRYKLELPCKILAETDLVKEYFGRHPVLHITFKDVRVSSVQDVRDDLIELVRFAYLAHSYLENANIFSHSNRTEYANKVCSMWCDSEEYKNENALFGLECLIQYLHAYHKRKVYLLVDEFDAPAVNALLAGKSRDEVRDIIYNVGHLLRVVKGEVADEHLLGSLITGVNYLKNIVNQHMNNVPVHEWPLDHKDRFAAYYGLGNGELTEHVPLDKEQIATLKYL